MVTVPWSKRSFWNDPGHCLWITGGEQMRITKYGLMIDQQRYTLIKESAVNYAADELTTDTQLWQMFNDLYKLNQLAEEHVYLVAFTNKGRPLGVFEVSHGSGSASFLQPREVFMRLLLAGASAFAIAHNHLVIVHFRIRISKSPGSWRKPGRWWGFR